MKQLERTRIAVQMSQTLDGPAAQLTILGGYTRYLPQRRGLKSTAAAPACSGFEVAFREFRLPEVIHTDNGVPFGAPSSVLGLSRLSVWLVKLGIRLERSRPGKPQDNGSHERMHRTLNEFRTVYNEERPHHALQLETPASLYTPSERR